MNVGMSPQQPRLDDLRIERTDAPSPSNRILNLLVVAVVLALVAVIGWWLFRPKAVTVRVATVRSPAASAEAPRTVLNTSGYVTARREATVSSKITGKVTDVLIEEGDHVQEGQILARLDDANVQANLQLAQAQVASARTALEETRVLLQEAELEWNRQKGLLQRRVASQADYDHAEAAAQALQARLARQTADVTVADRSAGIWRQQADDTIIRAPFAGIVTSKNAQPGEMISPMSAGGGFTRTGICTIVDMDSLEIEIDVNESYINRVSRGQPVEATLDAYPDWKLPCHVIAIIPTADRQKSTVTVRVGFDRLDPRILPEMSVKVAFRDSAPVTPSASVSRVYVPQGAIRQQDGRDVVFVIRAGRAERRAVAVVATQSGESELSAGVSPGETIAVDPPPELADGTAVKEQTHE